MLIASWLIEKTTWKRESLLLKRKSFILTITTTEISVYAFMTVMFLNIHIDRDTQLHKKFTFLLSFMSYSRTNREEWGKRKATLEVTLTYSPQSILLRIFYTYESLCHTHRKRYTDITISGWTLIIFSFQRCNVQQNNPSTILTFKGRFSNIDTQSTYIHTFQMQLLYFCKSCFI